MLDNALSISRYKFDAISRKIMRYAIGMVVLFGIAFSYNWPLSFIIIIFGNMFLLGSKPTFKFAFDFVYKFTIGALVGIFLGYFLLEYDLIYIPLIGLIMLYLYYADASIISPMLKIALIIMVLVVPLFSIQSPAIGAHIGYLIVAGAIISLLLTFVLFALIPDKELSIQEKQNTHPAPAQNPTEMERFSVAIRTLIVVYPLIIIMFYFKLQSDAVVLIYVGMYSTVPGFTKNLAIGKNMIVSCFAGGIIAFVIYELLVITPLFTFFLLLIFGVALWAGNELLTAGKYAIKVKSGFSAMVIILSGAISSDEADAGGKLITRIFQITFVIVYMVIAFRLIEKLFPNKIKNT